MRNVEVQMRNAFMQIFRIRHSDFRISKSRYALIFIILLLIRESETGVMPKKWAI